MFWLACGKRFCTVGPAVAVRQRVAAPAALGIGRAGRFVSTMRAVRVDEFGDSSALSCADVDVPRVAPNQVLVQVGAV